MSWYQNAKYKQPPFSYEIAAIKEDFVWAFNPDKKIYPIYEESKRTHNDPEFRKCFLYNKLLPYNEYRILTSKEELLKELEPFPPNLDGILLFLFCLPRPRGIRVNRKNGLFMH